MRYNIHKAILLFLTVFLLLTTVKIQAQENYYFKQISLDDGLSQSTVRCILNDRKGFIWIGTRSGLNRFDRYTLKKYFYNTGDSTSIPGNQINFLNEDKEGNIWVGTQNGLARYDPLTDKFIRILFQRAPLVVRSAVELPKHMLFGGAGKLYKFDFSNKNLTAVSTKGKEKSVEMFSKMVGWHKDAVLLQTRRDGLWQFNPVDNSLQRASFLQEKELIGLYVDKQKNLWISPYGKGVLEFDERGRKLRHYTSQNSALNNNIVLDISAHEQKIWLATDGGGINIIDLTTGKFSVLTNIAGNAVSLPDNSIFTLYLDHENNLWAGSVRAGLISIRKTFMTTFRDAPLGGKHGISQKTVLCVHPDRSGGLWIGTDGGGINRFDPKESTFKHVAPTYGLKVASITDFSDRELLLYAFSRGLYIMDKLTGAIRPFEGMTSQQAGYLRFKGIAINVSRVSKDYIYLFTDEIIRYHIPTRTFAPVSFDSSINANSSFLKLYTDQDFTYLFGPYSVFKLDHKQNKITLVFKLQNNGNPIITAGRDRKGVFWIGNREGLMYYDVKARKLRQVRTSLFNDVSAITIDRQDRIWIGAQNMVFSYHAKEKKFLAFGESDGVVPNEFFHKAATVLPSGEIYMGGVKGLLNINNDIPSNSTKLPKTELMGLEVNGLPVNIDLQAEVNKIDIPFNHTSLLITVMAREQDVFRKKMFRFKISGLDERVIETYDHSLPVGSLPVGKYQIMVSTSLQNGGWSHFTPVLVVNVNPPWFRSTWFIILVVLTISSAIGTLYKLAINKRERKLSWKLKEHKQESDEAKIKFLIHISHELRTPLTLIHSPLQRILNEKQLNPELSAKLSGVYKQAENMRGIIDMVLDLQKIELGEQQLILAAHALNLWVTHIGENFSEEFTQKQINVHYDLDDTVKDIVFDIRKCSFVLTNLLSNALKFSPRGSNIKISTRRNDGIIRISVYDEGIGLAHADSAHLFKPFYQGMHQEYGSGIGLSYAKAIVEMHHGKIAAVDNDTKGAIFYFELPDNLFPTANANKPKLPPSGTTAVSSKLELVTDKNIEFDLSVYTILIVEDEPELRIFLKDYLKPHFKKVVEAKNGLQALLMIKNQHPDIVLSDVMMPELDGFEMCRRLKDDVDVSHIPVVLLTTQGDAQSRNLGYKLGADAYIAKPFDLDSLQTILINILRNREAIKTRYKTIDFAVSAKQDTFSNADERFLLKLNELIYGNLDNEELDVEFLTDEMAMSRASLYSKLKNLADMGVNDYINKIRLERAAHLLKNTDKTMMEIADNVGFANQRYFSTVFKQYYEVTPTVYRNSNRQL